MLKGRVLGTATGLPRLFSTPAEDRFDVLTVQGGELRADKHEQVVVFGGNGFVGSEVCKALSLKGKKVLSINRSGTPRQSLDWMKNVKYLAGVSHCSLLCPDRNHSGRVLP